MLVIKKSSALKTRKTTTNKSKYIKVSVKNKEVPNLDTIEAFEEFGAIKDNLQEYKRYDSFSDTLKDLIEEKYH